MEQFTTIARMAAAVSPSYPGALANGVHVAYSARGMSPYRPLGRRLMSIDCERLFTEFDRGRLSRRQLLIALGAAAAVRPASALAQGQCGGARAGTPECDPTP